MTARRASATGTPKAFAYGAGHRPTFLLTYTASGRVPGRAVHLDVLEAGLGQHPASELLAEHGPDPGAPVCQRHEAEAMAPGVEIAINAKGPRGPALHPGRYDDAVST
jgi:hypothetical protein